MNKWREETHFIQNCVREGRLFWTYHANIRLSQRFIDRRIALESVDQYEIIEYYPEQNGSHYLPNYLVYTEYQREVFHILFALDKEDQNVRIITVYRPAPEAWDEGFRRRKKP